MLIDKVLLDKLADLSRLSFSREEKTAMIKDLNALVGWVKQLDEFIVNDEELEPDLVLQEEHLRQDKVDNTLTHQQGLAQATSCDSSYFRVPSVKS